MNIWQHLHLLFQFQSEKCIKPYIDNCDLDQNSVVNSKEWCRCFEKTDRPCAAGEIAFHRYWKFLTSFSYWIGNWWAQIPSILWHDAQTFSNSKLAETSKNVNRSAKFNRHLAFHSSSTLKRRNDQFIFTRLRRVGFLSAKTMSYDCGCMLVCWQTWRGVCKYPYTGQAQLW